MTRIHQLPSHVITQIAAGEVIERPASVVKELIENSLDAGATRIDIELELGGTELIRVTDDGSGIHPDDLALAFSPHATSKLRDADDLFRIATMGFRGEALASVGGVARVLLQSRPRDTDAGHEVRCDGGVLGDVRPCGVSPGTRIEVKHLFYNIPGRKKFLKSLATEHSHTCEIVTRMALAHPGVHFSLRHNGKTTYEIPPTENFVDRVGFFFGSDVREALLSIDSGPGSYRVTGCIADPKCDRGNAKLQYFYVNGRWFRDRSLGYALQEGYRGLLMTGRYPIAFLFLTMPPDQLDVNVHPTKAEVRFRDSAIVFSLLRSCVKTRLLGENLIPELQVPAQNHDPAPVQTEASLFSPRQTLSDQSVAPWEEPARIVASGDSLPRPTLASPFMPVVRPVSKSLLEQLEPSEALPAAESKPEVAPAPPAASTPAIPPEQFPAGPADHALQLHDSYLVLETPQGMLVIDQHALHERILYEQLRRRIREGKLEVQRLLIPEPIDLPADQATRVLEAAEALAELGLEVSDFGGNTVLLSSYPTLLSRRAPHEILQAVIDYLVTHERAPAREVLLNDLLATMACKAAVKAGDRLTPDEISHLLHLRQMAEDSHHCPHGRPTSLLFSRQELDRQFRRI